MGRNLADIKDDEALDLLADILDPVIEIASDPKVKEMVGDEKISRVQAVQYVIKNHKKPIMQILAMLDGVPVEEYHCNLLTLPAKLLAIFNDPEVMKLFT